MSAYDVVIVGAGFAGMYMLHKTRELGLSARVYEAGDGVGGTWYWNRYPGARCDVESMDYSYSFSPELEQVWQWTERYPRQPEILTYANHVADRFDLRKDIQFASRVTSAVYDEDAGLWRLTVNGEKVTATYVVMATGCLSKPKWPEVEGAASFGGRTFHTAQWPHEGVDFSGRRVAIIGTGSSGIQSIPHIAEQAGHLTVFQRTANYSIPAHHGPLDPDEQRKVKTQYRELRVRARKSPAGIPRPLPTQSALEVDPAERERVFTAAWERGGLFGISGAYTDIRSDQRANDTAAEFIRERIRATVRDPELAERLSPNDHPFGTKRPCLDTNYYQTYNRDNIDLIDLKKTPIVEITEKGVRTTEAEYEVDDLVFATGFDAMTGALLDIDPVGRAPYVPGPRRGRFPQHVHGHRSGQPVGAVEHDGGHRAARRVDRAVRHRPARPHHRGRSAGRGRVGGARQRARRPDAVPQGQLLVHGRERAGQAAGVHAVRRRHRGVPGGHRPGDGERVRRLCDRLKEAQ